MSNQATINIVDDHIAVITLNRPESANALSTTLLNELTTMIGEINQNKEIRCTILTGAKDKAFCAGADLKERQGMSDDDVVATVTYIGETMTQIEQMEMPVIAALNGVAFGGGLELALACDVRIAAKHADVGLTETSLAIIPGAGGTQRLTRLVGLGQAKKMIFTANRISAMEALDIGLVEQVVDKDDLYEEAIQLASQIISNGPIALKLAKQAINQGFETDLKTGLSIEQQCYRQTIPTQDRLEGLQAFQEKRKPKYIGL
ncbi:MAG TPA: enoyl-CoA hydratase [Virgibacillus sp.]|nr:enoyl-CoA hydratase [Virgibacillus sp.]